MVLELPWPMHSALGPMRSAYLMHSAFVFLHWQKLFDVQRQPSDAQRHKNLLQKQGFLPPLLGFPSNRDFGSPLDVLHNEMDR